MRPAWWSRWERSAGRRLLAALASGGWPIARPRPRFAHGGEVTLAHDGRAAG